MAVDIVAIGDTHCREWSEVHPAIREAVEQADVALHCGDFTYMGVVDGMVGCAKRAVVVHGNSDQVNVRRTLPYVEVLEVEGARIGVIHPILGRAGVRPGGASARLSRSGGRDSVRPLPRADKRGARWSPVRQPRAGLRLVHGALHHRPLESRRRADNGPDRDCRTRQVGGVSLSSPSPYRVRGRH